MRTSKRIIKSDAQKKMAKYGCGHTFHDLKYLDFGNFCITWVHYKLEGTITNFGRKKINLMCIDHIWNKIETITCSTSPTCTLLAPSSKICRFFLKFFCQHELLGFVDQGGFLNVYKFFLHMELELCTWPCLCPYQQPYYAFQPTTFQWVIVIGFCSILRFKYTFLTFEINLLKFHWCQGWRPWWKLAISNHIR